MRIYLKRVALTFLAAFAYLTVFYVFPGALDRLQNTDAVGHSHRKTRFANSIDDKRRSILRDNTFPKHPEEYPDTTDQGDPQLPVNTKRKLDDRVLGYIPDKTNHEVLNASMIHLKVGAGIWYDKNLPHEDRILSQLKHVPDNYAAAMASGNPLKPKLILKYSQSPGFGDTVFKDQHCPVDRCQLTNDRNMMSHADAVVFDHVPVPRVRDHGNTKQVWVYYQLESPYHSSATHTHHVNWTATYRRDSTIVAPYAKFSLYDSDIQVKPQIRNYAEGKTKKVAWFVSNCGAPNGRSEYASELAKHIEVDIYGSCGRLRCPRHDSKNVCFEKLKKEYKFYLAFENSNCLDYITEKFFLNGLENDVIPVVMGAPPLHYRNAAPYHSFIHVDEFESPSALAEYLHKLDQNDDLYNEYFQWKGTGEFINTFFYCRLCSMLHASDGHEATWYDDVGHWWHEDVCIGRQSWRNITHIPVR